MYIHTYTLNVVLGLRYTNRMRKMRVFETPRCWSTGVIPSSTSRPCREKLDRGPANSVVQFEPLKKELGMWDLLTFLA